MRIVVPDYYKDFECIANECEDTCCAGWEVDVDQEKYNYYKTVTGPIGDRLKEVMIPKQEGEGCTFKLKDDKGCPFLNEENYCDLYIALGEESLCETCTYFPRFINYYGGLKEIGLAPSCFTAAQIMVNKKERTHLVESNDPSLSPLINEIDPEVYLILKSFREEVFDLLWDKAMTFNQRLLKILKKSILIQKELEEYFDYDENVQEKINVNQNTIYDLIFSYIDNFEGVEIINPNWSNLVDYARQYLTSSNDEKEKVRLTLLELLPEKEQAFEQVTFYYLYRYLLEAVYDGELVRAIKVALIAYLANDFLCEAYIYCTKKMDANILADIFHLYSRQLEHSEINFDYYLKEYGESARYSSELIEELLIIMEKKR